MKRKKGEGGGFWLVCIVLLLATVVLLGGAICTGMRHHQSVHPNIQESFTVPMNDRSDTEIAVYGPDTIVEGGSHA